MLQPWTGDVALESRRIVFHKATKASTGFASVTQSGLIVEPATKGSSAGGGAGAPTLPPLFLALLAWRTVKGAGPGLVNVGSSSYINTALQV